MAPPPHGQNHAPRQHAAGCATRPVPSGVAAHKEPRKCEARHAKASWDTRQPVSERLPENPAKTGADSKKGETQRDWNARGPSRQSAQEWLGDEPQQGSPSSTGHHSDHSTVSAASSEELAESSVESSCGRVEEDSEMHPLREEDGRKLGGNLLTLLRASPASASRRKYEPKPLSTDEYALWVMQAREDKEMGADELNAETFGEDAGDGWSFEENLAAVTELQKAEAKAWKLQEEAYAQSQAMSFGAGAGAWSPWPQACRGRRPRERLCDRRAAKAKFTLVVEALRYTILQELPCERVEMLAPGDEGHLEPDGKASGWTLTLYLKNRGFQHDAPMVLMFAQNALFKNAADTALGWQLVGCFKGSDERDPSFVLSAVLFDEAMRWTGVNVEVKRLPRAHHSSHRGPAASQADADAATGSIPVAHTTRVAHTIDDNNTFEGVQLQ
mmetsp:Transcript_49252/g.125087  ORF Transcript_49252/g.125087 Transcript_49252/m.125087 type:complete len:443 (-) Transcript_49252:85-1413(-)|eukprot:CAMPEP_0183527434 /NCGR_PEP_ID=MMETSP0371-20130417/22017_1 /TAXON_ID=268820 /ORGANISM="Peridinium aciculiferum, Strain PAER-2" /LENGTH=442 /DNA_ID=CAMNT_0025726905 /DNA_START=15 /DNA_END=1343 /DNA_ORIENTATION=+